MASLIAGRDEDFGVPVLLGGVGANPAVNEAWLDRAKTLLAIAFDDIMIDSEIVRMMSMNTSS